MKKGILVFLSNYTKNCFIKSCIVLSTWRVFSKYIRLFLLISACYLIPLTGKLWDLLKTPNCFILFSECLHASTRTERERECKPIHLNKHRFSPTTCIANTSRIITFIVIRNFCNREIESRRTPTYHILDSSEYSVNKNIS